MSSQLILDWDPEEVRMLVLDERGRVTRADSAELSDGAESSAALAAALRPLVEDYAGGKVKTTVVASGGDLQFRRLQVPPAPADELPDLVQMRAMSEFPPTEDAGVVDYQPCDSGPDEPQSVVAARLSAAASKLARAVCDDLNLPLQSIVPRGCGLATLAVNEQASLTSGAHLLVAQRPGELDLVGLDGGAAAVVRSVPLNSEGAAEQVAKAASREVRRTTAAITQELKAATVDSVVWLSGSRNDELLAKAAVDEVTTIDIGQPAKFASLLGTARMVAAGKPPIDFISPKQRVERETPKRTLALAGIAAALCIGFAGWMLYSRVASIESETASLTEELAQVEADIEDLTPEQNKSRKVAAWLATDVNWLDEIDRLSITIRPLPLSEKEFNAEQDAMLTSLVANKAAGSRGVGGTLLLDGRVRDDAILQQLEQQLRDPQHAVNPKSVVNDPENRPYISTFQTNIEVTPPVEE